MRFFTQSRFPLIWKVFQYCVGGTVDKRNLCAINYKRQKNVLEIGCSVGNIAEFFKSFPGINYTGIDIDPVVIKYAKKHFISFRNFRFICKNFQYFAKQSKEKFDYILFAGVLHHVDNMIFKDLLSASSQILEDNGTIAVVEPLMPTLRDNWFIRLFIRFEQGKFVRDDAAMTKLLETIPELRLKTAGIHYVGATPFSTPKCARFGVYGLAKSEKSI